MKNLKNKSIAFLFVIVFFGFVNNVHASVSITTDVDVPASCDATDTDNVVHNYPQGNSYLAICALQAALANTSVSSAKLSNQYPSMGLFITSLNNVDADPNSQYWAIYQNGNPANAGITSLPVLAGDTIVFKLNDFSDHSTGDQVTLNIRSLVSAIVQNNGGGGGGGVANPIFSVSNANNFLASKQNMDGSFWDMLYTDWVAISSGVSNPSFLASLKNYLQNTILNSNVVTDNERHAMALSALGINPYTGTSINYIKKITDSFDGTQIGDSSLINDDIFGLIILGKSGFTQSDELISKDINYVISKQSTDGSWGGSVDMTAAGLQALRMYNVNSDVISRAENYLTTNQNQADGGFGNSFSTSWVLQAIYPNNSIASHSSRAENYLAKKQQSDGGMEGVDSDVQNRIWATSYAIPATMHKSFSDSLSYFDKFTSTASSGGGSVLNDVKKEIKKDEAIVKKDNLVEKIPEIKNEEIIPINIKEVVKKPKTNQISKNKIKTSQIKETPKSPVQTTELNLSASAADSGVSDRVYHFMGGVWGGISNVFKGFISIFN